MPQISLWRDLARKAAQTLRRQLAQTENGLAALLNPGKRQAIPIPVRNPQRRAPRFPGDKRFYTQFTHRASSQTPKHVKTEFGRSSTRPRLTGTLRSHGYRTFSSSPCNHAHVAREVYAGISQGIRAGTLNLPFYPPPTGGSQKPGTVFHAAQQGGAAAYTTTVLTLPLVPAMIMPKTGSVDAVVRAADEVLCAVPQYLAKLRRELSRLSKSGSFEYALHADSIEVAFHGKDSDQVERFLQDVGVTLGTLRERPALGVNQFMDWRSALRKGQSNGDSVTSLERYVNAIDDTRFAARTKTPYPW